MKKKTNRIKKLRDQILQGGPQKYHERNSQQGKQFVRSRIGQLVDEIIFEDGLFANCESQELACDAVVTCVGRIGSRRIAIMANDSTVKGGSWGPKTVEKILRIQDISLQNKIPMIYLIDSAGARITEQIDMFPGRRGAGRIFHNQVLMNGLIPQICAVLGPSFAGGAYIPMLSDVIIMVDKISSMALAGPRMIKQIIAEDTDIEQVGGASLHCKSSGCADMFANDEKEALDLIHKYLHFMPDNCHEMPQIFPCTNPHDGINIQNVIIPDESKPFDMYQLIHALIDGGTFLEMKKLWAKELITGFARMEGIPIGIVANQSGIKSGALYNDSSDKGARFVSICNAYSIPLVFLADVPGFIPGNHAETNGILRHGAKFIQEVSSATVPRICVVVRKAYGAGLYAMSGPGFLPDCTIAFPMAMIGVMGALPAVHAVFQRKIDGMDEKDQTGFIEKEKIRYNHDINIMRLASELIVDDVIPPEELRYNLINRLKLYFGRKRELPDRYSRIRQV